MLELLPYLRVVRRLDHVVEEPEDILLHRVRLTDVLDELVLQFRHGGAPLLFARVGRYGDYRGRVPVQALPEAATDNAGTTRGLRGAGATPMRWRSHARPLSGS